MIDSQCLDELPLVRKIRETIRKWWSIEIAFADVRGYVSDHARGIIVPPHNVFCQAALGSPEGFRRCNKSIEQATDAIREEGGRKARVVNDCHLGFPVVMAPVMHGDHFYGTVFTGGFLIAGQAEAAREIVTQRAREMRLRVGPSEAALGTIPELRRRDVGYLLDFLETVVAEMLTLVAEQSGPRPIGDLIGTSPSMQRLQRLVEKVAESDATVLVTGENGTGKGVLARSIHDRGPRRDKAFVATNCSALNENLLESELFGHVKGAFTGAIRDKQGLFKVADGGTLFLDEVGDMSPAMQAKLLIVLQEGILTPVGATEPVEVDVRVIAATNRAIRDMVQDGEFREDLYYRLSVIGLELPPLRERKSDLPKLCEHFLDRMQAKTGGRRRSLSQDVMKRFWEYEWPGNIRQLENEIERLVVLSGDEAEIGPEMLSPALVGDAPTSLPIGVDAEGSLHEAVAVVERQMIHQGLIRTGWNKKRLARELGVSRTTLIKKIQDFGLEERRDAAG